MATSVHPVADILPLMTGEEFEDLVADIRANGLIEPLVLHPDGSLLDGRNRERACARAGVPPRYVTWAGEPGTEAAYVISANLRRRHLDASQRAMMAARIANLPHGVRTDRPANLPVLPISQPQAAAMANVSERSVRLAKRVIDAGDPDLVAAVDRGEVAVSKAAKQVAASAPGAIDPDSNDTPQQRRKNIPAPPRPTPSRTPWRFWTQLRDGVELLGGLPDAAEVARQVPPARRAELPRKVDQAITWLQSLKENLNG